MFSKVILAGYLTRDPELKYTTKGTPVCSFGVGVNRSWTTESGEKKEDVTFVDCTAWNRSAETICQYLKKGYPILVEGELRCNTWETQAGEQRSKLYVHVEGHTFLPRRDHGASPAPASRKERVPAETGGHGADAKDDVPF